MNCRHVTNLMSAYVDGELTGTEMLTIRRHISDCPDCADEWEATRIIKQAVSGLGAVTPRKDFAVSILRRLDEVEVPTYQRWANTALAFLHRKLSPVAAALAASGVALVILTAGGMDSTPVMDTAQSTPANGYQVSFLSGAREMSAAPAYALERPAQFMEQAKPRFNLASLSR